MSDDVQLTKALNLLTHCADTLQRVVLCGCKTTPRIEATYKRLYNPIPGDMVMEVSSDIEPLTRIGRLICERREWVEYPDNTRDTDDEDQGYWEKYTYIEGMDGGLKRWVNCRLLGIPDNWLWVDRLLDPSYLSPPKPEWDGPGWAQVARIRYGLESDYGPDPTSEVHPNPETCFCPEDEVESDAS